MKMPRPTMLFSAVAAIVAILFIFSALVFPWLIDSQVIKDKLATALSRNSQARVTLHKMVFGWFPRPYLVIEDAAVYLGGRVQASIPRVEIYPSVFYLFTGRWMVRRAVLEGAKLTIRLPENAIAPFNLESLEKQIRSALIGLTSEWLMPRIALSDASAEIVMSNKPPVSVQHIAAEITASRGHLGLDFAGRSSLWGSLKVKGRIDPQSLAARLEITVERLKIREAVDSLTQLPSENLPLGAANLNATIAAVGLRQATVSIGGSTGPLVFVRHGHHATMAIKNFKGGIAFKDGDVQADLEQLDLASPRLKASGQLKMHSGALSGNIKAVDVDIAEVGGLTRKMFGETEAFKTMLRYVPVGTIPEISIQTSGDSFTDLVSRRNLVVVGSLRDGRLFIPGADLEFRNVSGSVRMAAGTLEGREISANLGTARAWNGVLRLGLDGKPTAPFHLDLSLHTRAAELQSILLKLIPDGTLRGELLKVRNLEGELSGRLTLGETLGAIAPVVAISEANLAATYDPVPFAIALRGARFNYDQKIIKLDSAQSSLGRSRFAGLSVTLHHDPRRQISLEAKRSLLDLQQSHTLMRVVSIVPLSVANLQSVRGEIELENLSLAGAFDNPAGWAFNSAGTAHKIEIKHADFPDAILVSKAKFIAKQDRLLLSDVGAIVSDAALMGDIRVDYKKGAASAIEASGAASVGRQMTQWLSRSVALPQEFKLRPSLNITEGHFGWDADGVRSFRASVTAAGGTLITLAAVKRPQSVAVETLTVEDGDRHAWMSFQIGRDNVQGSFKGELTQATIDKIFTSFPMEGSSLRGDMEVSAMLADLGSFSAHGQLSGENLIAWWGSEKVKVEKFSLDSSAAMGMVGAADLRWRNSRLSVSGKIDTGKDAWRLDLDASGDRLSLNEIDQLIGKRVENNTGRISLPRLEGTIRLSLDSFATEHFVVSGLRVRTDLSSALITAEIQRGAVCGLDTQGRIQLADKNLDFDLHVSATDALLEPTTICLSNQQSDIKGTYSLSARVAGRGLRNDFLKSLHGNFDFRARNGEFIRSPGIDATFDYLNSTGDFNVAFPDLDREAFPYSFVGVKGRFEGNMLIGDEVNVESTLLNLSGQGKVDLERRQIDAKGLIAVLKPVDDVIRRIPVISSVIGGSLIGIPVRISGSLARPNVTYLSPADIGSELLNIPLRILGLPLGAMQLFTPSGNASDQSIAE